MNHKKRRAPHQRAGCGLCKPHKKNGRNGAWAQPRQELRAQQAHDEGLLDAQEHAWEIEARRRRRQRRLARIDVQIEALAEERNRIEAEDPPSLSDEPEEPCW